MNDNRRLGVRLHILVLPLLGACSSSLFDSDAPVSTSYVLAPAAAVSSSISATQVDLAIGWPDLAPGLDTDRIAVLKGRQLDYYRGVRWGGRAAEVLQTLLVDSLEDQRLFRSVTAEESRVAIDYVLDVTVRDFQAEYATDKALPSARVTMIGHLIRVADRALVGTLVATAHSKAQDDRMGAVAAAFESAAQQVALDLARKTAVAVAGDEPHLRAARGEGDGK